MSLNSCPNSSVVILTPQLKTLIQIKDNLAQTGSDLYDPVPGVKFRGFKMSILAGCFGFNIVLAFYGQYHEGRCHYNSAHNHQNDL